MKVYIVKCYPNGRDREPTIEAVCSNRELANRYVDKGVTDLFFSGCEWDVEKWTIREDSDPIVFASLK